MGPNVLISCAGRRNYLVDYFRASLAGSGKVIATDVSPYAVALAEADEAVVAPPVFNADYVDWVLELCRTRAIGLVISVNDHELPILAVARERFAAEGVTLAVSDSEVISVCFDKVRTFELITRLGVRVPETWTTLEEAEGALDAGVATFPLIVKPRWGSGSFGLFTVHDREELRHAAALLTRMTRRSLFKNYEPEAGRGSIVIQPLIQGTEYGLDVVNDLEGRHVGVLVKRKLGMRSGETDKAITVDDPQLTDLGRRLAKETRHVANLDCDVIRSGGELYVLDLNPRFGGGYPFSQMAGADLPAAILAWSRGEVAREEWLHVEPGVLSAKCDRMVQIRAEAPTDRC